MRRVGWCCHMGCRPTELATFGVDHDRRGHLVASEGAEWLAEVLESWDSQLLAVEAVGTGIKVIHCHRRERLGWEHQSLVHLRTAVRGLRTVHSSTAACRLVRHCRAIARAAHSEARGALRTRQAGFGADATARLRGARAQQCGTEVHTLVAAEVDLCKAAARVPVGGGVARRVARSDRQFEIEVHRAATRGVHSADVDEAHRRWCARVRPVPTEIAVQQVRRAKVEAHTLTNARCERRRRRWGRLRR